MNAKESFHILITDRFHLESEIKLRTRPGIIIQHALAVQPTSDELKWSHALIIRSRTRIDQRLLESAPDLKVIVTATSGFDHIDLKAAQRVGITIMHTPEANATSAAELTWALILACARKVPMAHRAVKDGSWRLPQLTGIELDKKTCGIIGLGRVGSRVAKMALGFGLRVLAYDPYIADSAFAEAGATRSSFEEVLKQSDVLTFHVPETAETRHMLNRNYLDLLSPSTIVINTSRGKVIDESDLARALQLGQIAAAGLDVFASEPLPRHSHLLQLENVVLTPHVGATTEEAFKRASDQAGELIFNFLTAGTICHGLPGDLESL